MPDGEVASKSSERSIVERVGHQPGVFDDRNG